MDTEKLVVWIMKQPINWMANLAPIAPGKNNANFYLAQNQRGISQYEFNNTLKGIANQPPLPKGEWFTAQTKHAYCVDCGQWQPVKHHWANGDVHCDKCGYLVADFDATDGEYTADGDSPNEYIWDAKTRLYTHVDNYGGEMWREDEDEPIQPPMVIGCKCSVCGLWFYVTPHLSNDSDVRYKCEACEKIEDYPLPLKSEWMRVVNGVTLTIGANPNLLVTAHQIDELPPEQLTLRAIDAWLNTQPQEVFESLGTISAYAMQKAIEGLTPQPARPVTPDGYIASLGGWE